MGVAVGFFSEIMRTLRHPLASDAGLLAASQYVAAGLGFITAIGASRLLGPADYGVAALVMAYPTLLWSFVGTKSVSVTTRYVSSFLATGQKEELKAMCKVGYGLDFLVSAVAFVLVGITSWWVARSVYGMPQMSWLMVIFAAFFPFISLTGTSWAILSSWQRFGWLAAFQVLAHGIPCILVVWLLLVGMGVPGMVLGTAIGQAVVGLAMVCATTYTLCREEIGSWWKASLGNVASLRKELTAFFGWNYLMVTFSGLMGQVPLMFLGHLRGPEEAGFYRLAMSLMTAGSYLEASLGRVAYPVLSARWGAGEGGNLNKTLKRWTLRGGLPVSSLMLLTIPLLPIAVPMVFGLAYRPMVVGTQVMMVGAAVSAIFFWLSSFYYASGRIGLWTKAYSLYTAIVVGLAWFCIQRWGFSGLAGIVGMGKVLFTVSMVSILVTAGRRRSESLRLPQSR